MTHPLLDAYQPTDDDPFDTIKAAHLLSRAGFGGTPDEIAKIVKLGPGPAVDMLLAYPDVDPTTQGGGTDGPTFPDGLPNSVKDQLQLEVGLTQAQKKAARQKLQNDTRQAIISLGRWWLTRMAYGPNPLQEKLTLFWHGHFTSSYKDVKNAIFMWNQNELLRRMGAGNVIKFVKAVSRDPAMLEYLDNQQNVKAHPNENYARELMELFTLGIGNYTEDDVKAGARSFTGFAHDGVDYFFRTQQHDNSNKTFLGETGNFDGDDVVDIIYKQKSAGPFLAGELYQYFVADDMDPDVQESAGQILKDGNWEMRPFLKTLLTSKVFYSPATIGSQIKCPVQLLVGTTRMLGVDFPADLKIESMLLQMGQTPLDPPNVKGWPGGHFWINTSTMFARYNTAVWLAGGDSPVFGKGRQKIGGGDVKFTPDTTGTPDQIVDLWIGKLIQRPIDADKRQDLVDSLGSKPGVEDVRKMIQLVVSMPEYQLT